MIFLLHHLHFLWLNCLNASYITHQIWVIEFNLNRLYFSLVLVYSLFPPLYFSPLQTLVTIGGNLFLYKQKNLPFKPGTQIMSHFCESVLFLYLVKFWIVNLFSFLSFNMISFSENCWELYDYKFSTLRRI